MAGPNALQALAERAPGASLQVTQSHVLGLTAFLTVGGLAIANGGFFPVSWGWSSLALLWLAALVLLLGRPSSPTLLQGIYLALVAALTAWTFVSAAWTSSVTGTIAEGERSLVYLAGALAALLLLRGASQRAIVLGAWSAIALVSLYALSTRLFPTRFGRFEPIAGYRLSDPLGYWNALGLLAAMGLLLALGLAARERPTVRALAAASSVVLVLTIYFTFSRGGWIAFFGGLVAVVAVDRRRLQLIMTGLVVAIWGAVAVWLASRSDALTDQNTSLTAASRDGHGLAVIVIALATAAALSVLLLDALEPKALLPRGAQRAFVGTLLFLLAAVLIVAAGRYGGPTTIAHRAWNSFKGSPIQTQGNLNTRLFSLSGTGRLDQWRVARDEYAAHPWLGSGAGTYAEYWFEKRPSSTTVHDVHNVYLETLAELGPVGLTLLVGIFAVPLIGLWRSRSSGPLTAAAFGAYLAYWLHAAVDWDWEMPAVTLVAIFCGLVLLGPEPASSEKRRPGLWTRLGGVAAVLATAAFAFVTLIGNSASSASSTAAQSGNWRKAESEARRASTWLPWSSDPWRLLGEAQYGRRNLVDARRSFRKAIADDRREWTLWFELALASDGRARRLALAEASRLNPRSPEIASFRTSLGSKP
jgi:O-antigen ligase